MPVVSIIVPVYNAEKHLNRCIDSILLQSYKDFELLLIDDGSEDKSGLICDDYANIDKRIKTFHKTNEGVSSARNIGLEKARGKWIAFVDSDDYVFPNWLSIFIENSEMVDIVICGFECNRLINDSYPSYKIGFNYRGGVKDGLYDLYKYPMVGSIWNKCFKREIIESNKIRFNIKFNVKEDEDFFLRYIAKCNLMCSTEYIGYYYYVPIWSEKYIVTKNAFLLYENLYNSIKQIFHNEINEITMSYMSFFSNALYDSFKLEDVDCLSKLYKYRKSLGKNVLSTKFFFITKWLIYLDYMGYFAFAMLWFQSHFQLNK